MNLHAVLTAALFFLDYATMCTAILLPAAGTGTNRRAVVSQTLAIAAAAATASTGNGSGRPLTANAQQTSKQKQQLNFPRVHPGLTVGNTATQQICEIFVDFTCPYSRKIFQLTSADDFLANNNNSNYKDKMAFVYHNVLQPWHHQSLWLHESSFVVKMLYPEIELAYWKALFEDAPRWYDSEIYALTRGQFYDRIAEFAANVIVQEQHQQQQQQQQPSSASKTHGSNVDTSTVPQIKARIQQYLIPPLQPMGHFPEEDARTLGLGSSPTDDENAIFPYTRQMVKFQRKRGVHVTPTVFFNGIEQGQISSGWTTKEWNAFLSQALLD